MDDVVAGDTDEFAISCESARADSARRRNRNIKGFNNQSDENAFRNNQAVHHLKEAANTVGNSSKQSSEEESKNGGALDGLSNLEDGLNLDHVSV